MIQTSKIIEIEKERYDKMSKTIYLDPGHGGSSSPGAVNGNRLEKNDTLAMAKAVRGKLVLQGHTVVLTRDGDTNPSLENRIGQANTAGADIFVSLHRNSHTDKTAKGIEIWVRYNNHVAAAVAVLEELVKYPHQEANRGVKIGAYKVLYNAKMPAMLIELGFISNTEDNRLFDKHFDDYATAIAKGIVSALGEQWQILGKPNLEKPPYRVQVGAFGVKANAEAFLQSVKNKGLEAFLVAPEEEKAEVE